MNISQIGIYSAISRTKVGNTSFKGNEASVQERVAARLNSYVKPVTDYDITHLDLPDYTKPEKKNFLGKISGASSDFDVADENSSWSRLEKSNDAADKVIRYTLQQTLEGNASAKSNFNYQGLDSTKELGATFRNGISVSLKYNLSSTDRPNIITVTARNGEKQEILLYDNGLQRSKRVGELMEALILV
jgi:hypothetical protein